MTKNSGARGPRAAVANPRPQQLVLKRPAATARARRTGRPPQALASANRAATARERQRLGRLSDLQIGPRTVPRYLNALQRFFAWMFLSDLRIPPAREDLDAITTEWIETLRLEGGGRSLAADTLSAIQWKVKGYKHHLQGSWD